MPDLTSINAIETLISTLAGSHESATVKADIAIAGTALSLLASTLIPSLAPSVDVTGIDAAVTKIVTGISDLRAAVAPAPAQTAEAVANA